MKARSFLPAVVVVTTMISPAFSIAASSDTSILYASVTCTPASKPGRIRCRATVELPLDTTASRKLAWGELVVVSAGTGVLPLRGRLGILDAEVHDEQRITWSFSVAAADIGERPLDLVLRATLEQRSTGAATLVERPVHTTVKVAP